jgi:hypothetical protein
MASIAVNADNFVRAETDRMFRDLAGAAGAVNRWSHNREPTPVDQQTVIRMNRDTLYSFAVVDLAAEATVTLPESGPRYLSVMVVNQDHYINHVFHHAGTYQLNQDEFDTRYVVLAARVLADPNDAEDLATAHQIQDGLTIAAASAEPYAMPDYDEQSFASARAAVLQLAALGGGVTRTFGPRQSVDPIHHLLGTAFGWGGLPETEAVYEAISPDLPVADYQIHVADVPVDAFWSVSVYNADGFFEPNDQNAYSINNITATKNGDGTITVNLGAGPSDQPNFLPITNGWNYLVRLYRPQAPIRDGQWRFPTLEPA